MLPSIPLLASVPAGDWRVAMSTNAIEAEEWVPGATRCSPLTYALRVDGISMQPEYDPGDIILCDPEAEPVHGSDVVVRQPDGEVTFKRLVREGGACLLRPLNPDWPGPRLIAMDHDYEVVAVVVWRYQNKRKG